MHEQSKAAKRRVGQPAFMTRYFVGQGIDIGAGPDGLSRYCGVFPLLRAVRDWDLPDGDAQYLDGVADQSLDFVHASHCLEHMRDPRVALANWLRVLRPGGHVVVTVPDEDMYERGVWPSRRNADHKWTFSAGKRESWSPVSVNVLDLAREFADLAELERLEVVRDFFRPELDGDQTMTPVAECAIEFVLRRSAAPPGLPPAARPLLPPTGRLRVRACRHGPLVFDPTDGEGAALDRHGEYAEPLLGVLCAILRPGDVALSYGGGGAVAAALARRVQPGGTVHAVALQPQDGAKLVANALLNELDGLHPATTAVAPDDLPLSACRLIHADIGTDMAWLLQGALATLGAQRPWLALHADDPALAAAILSRGAGAGYAAFWHVAPLALPRSHFGLTDPGPPRGTLVLAPPGATLHGLPAATGPDWRAA